jgi:hypothetical protein
MPAKGFRLSPFGGGVGGAGAPADAQYVVLTLNATLTSERVLIGTANQIIITDNGANSTVVLSLPQNIATTSSPTFVGLTLTGLTQGSVLFAGASGVISQDNANFFWNDTDNRLGIGTLAPATPLHIIRTTEQLRLGYDTLNYASFTVDSVGGLSIGLIGRNFAVGTSAGSGASNDSVNFLGYQAGLNATNAAGSNFLGFRAGSGATNAINSTFLGSDAGFGAVNAQNSFFIGVTAGSGATNAKNSIFIGAVAGFNDTVNNTVGTHTSIAIGNNSGTGGFSDSIALGHGVVNSAVNQLNLGNVLYITALYNSDTQSSTPITTATYTLPGFTSAGFVKTSSAGLLSVDTSTYLTAVTGTANRITVTGGTTIDIASTYVGQTSITTLGTIATGVWNGTAIGVAFGGTNITSYAVGDLIYASGATTLSKLADVAAGSYLRSGGVTTAPVWSTLILPNSATQYRVVLATATNTYGEDGGLTYNTSTDTLGLLLDNAPIVFGAGSDAKIVFTGTQMQVQSDLITATDSLLLRGGTAGVLVNIGATQLGSFNTTNTLSLTPTTTATNGISIVPSGSLTGAVNYIGMNISSTTAGSAGASYAVTGGLFALTTTKGINTGNDSSLIKAFDLTVIDSHAISGTAQIVGTAVQAILATVNISNTVTATQNNPTFLTHEASNYSVNSSKTFNLTGTIEDDIIGMEVFIFNSNTYTAGTVSSYATGLVAGILSQTTGTATFEENDGMYMGQVQDAADANYGIVLGGPISGGVDNLGIYDLTATNWAIESDNVGVLLGGGRDANITYDGTDLVIKSNIVGTGTIKFNASTNWTANGTATVTISNVAPAGVGTATISKWLTVKDDAGTVYYIPAWT